MNCNSCEVELKSVSDYPRRRWDDWTVQYYDVLAFEFIGGYGMYFDEWNKTQRDLTAIICKPCADKLILENPWIKELIYKKTLD